VSWQRDRVAEVDEGALCADGLDAAIIGTIERCGQPVVVVYDVEKCLDILARSLGSYEAAQEHFDFNVSGAWVGERTPAWFTRIRK